MPASRDYRERFGQDVVQRRSVLEALLEFGCFCLKFSVGEIGDLRLERVDGLDDRQDFFDFSLATGAYELAEQTIEHTGV